jgi:hypothetical protein
MKIIRSTMTSSEEFMITLLGVSSSPKQRMLKPTYQARQPSVSSKIFHSTKQFLKICSDGYRWKPLTDAKACSGSTSQMRNTGNSTTTSFAKRKTIPDRHGSDRLLGKMIR